MKCTHAWIYLDDNAKAICGLHWRLNPLMKNMVGVEVLKHVCTIYPTFSCILVSPTHVML